MYLYLSVSFIQMLKAASPVAVLFASWSWGVAEPNLAKFLNVLVIVFGVAVSSLGEIQFSWTGFFFQIGGTTFEAVRVVMIQVMLSGEGLNMDPLVSLYYYAPVCAVMNFLIALVGEVPKFKLEHAAQAGYGMLFLNASIAFILNVASVFLVRSSHLNLDFKPPLVLYISPNANTHTFVDRQNLRFSHDTYRHL